MMPKRVAETDPNTQISDFTGSGPFVFKQRRVEAGRQGRLRQVRQVQAAHRARLRHRRRQGRQGRPRRVARDLRPAAGRSTRCSPARSIIIEQPPHRPAAAAQGRRQHQAASTAIRSATSTRSASTDLHKPFDNPKVRQALFYAFNQKDFLEAVDRRPGVLQGLQGACSSAARRSRPTRAWTACSKSNFEKAQELLKEAGYDGTPIVLHALDRPRRADQPRAGREVADGEGRLQGRHAVDGLADASSRAAPRRIRRTRAAGTPSSPRGSRPTSSIRSSTGFMNCELRQGVVRLALRRGDGEAARRFRARDRSGQAEGDRRGRAGARDARSSTHVHLGQWYQPVRRRARTSTACLSAPAPVFWNISKSR